MKVVRKEEACQPVDWDLCWCDTGVTPDRLIRLKPYQRINHFPAMHGIARKDQLARNLNRMRRQFPQEYGFYPQTWLLPTEYSDFRAQFNSKKAKTFIIKPEAASQGYGIFLTRNFQDINRVGHCVAQRYIHQPYLIEGLKFDLRLYVLVAGCDPLRIFLYREGLTRLSTQPYKPPFNSNLRNQYMHLTNYAINKHNENFQFNETADKDDIGHKRSLSFFWKYLREKEGNRVDVRVLHTRIKDIIIKTLCSIQPMLAHSYHSSQPDDLTNAMAFEVLGIDILIDAELKPWLLEVNHTPSFSTDTPLDRKIKKNLINDTVRLLNLSYEDKIRQVGDNLLRFINKRREEQRNRMLTGKNLKMSSEYKARIKRIIQEKRNEFELKNLGSYDPIYLGGYQIIKGDGQIRAAVLQEQTKYDKFLERAFQLWEDFTTGGRRNVRKPVGKSVTLKQSTMSPPPQRVNNTMVINRQANMTQITLKPQGQQSYQALTKMPNHKITNSVASLIESVAAAGANPMRKATMESSPQLLAYHTQPSQDAELALVPTGGSGYRQNMALRAISPEERGYSKVKIGGESPHKYLNNSVNKLTEFSPLKIRSPSIILQQTASSQSIDVSTTKEHLCRGSIDPAQIAFIHPQIALAQKEYSFAQLAGNVVQLPPIVWSDAASSKKMIVHPKSPLSSKRNSPEKHNRHQPEVKSTIALNNSVLTPPPIGSTGWTALMEQLSRVQPKPPQISPSRTQLSERLLPQVISQNIPLGFIQGLTKQSKLSHQSLQKAKRLTVDSINAAYRQEPLNALRELSPSKQSEDVDLIIVLKLKREEGPKTHKIVKLRHANPKPFPHFNEEPPRPKNAIKFKGGVSLSSSIAFRQNKQQLQQSSFEEKVATSQIGMYNERAGKLVSNLEPKSHKEGGVYITSRFPSRKQFIERSKLKSRQSLSVTSPINQTLVVKREESSHAKFLSPQPHRLRENIVVTNEGEKQAVMMKVLDFKK